MAASDDALTAYTARVAAEPGTHALWPRWAEPGWSVRTRLLGTAQSSHVALWADDDGIVTPQSPEEARLCDLLELEPVTAGSTIPTLPALADELATLNATGSDATLRVKPGEPSTLETR